MIDPTPAGTVKRPSAGASIERQRAPRRENGSRRGGRGRRSRRRPLPAAARRPGSLPCSKRPSPAGQVSTDRGARRQQPHRLTTSASGAPPEALPRDHRPAPRDRLPRGRDSRGGGFAVFPISPWWKSPLHSSSDASRLTALFVGYICPICALLTPCQAGASLLSVQRGVPPRAAMLSLLDAYD